LSLINPRNLLSQCLARTDAISIEPTWSITLPNAIAIVQKTIEVTSNFDELVRKVSLLSDNGRIDIEKFLEILVSWEHAKVAIKEEEILQAFAFDSFDDRTYVVTYDELLTTIKRVNPTSQATDRQIMRVYREMTEHSDSIGVSSSKIINTLHKFGMLQWRNLPTPPTLDISLRSQVVFDYLAEVWNLEEEEVNAALMSDDIPPKIQQQLTEAMETFRKVIQFVYHFSYHFLSTLTQEANQKKQSKHTEVVSSNCILHCRKQIVKNIVQNIWTFFFDLKIVLNLNKVRPTVQIEHSHCIPSSEFTKFLLYFFGFGVFVYLFNPLYIHYIDL
jgi:hypothetical protein